MASAPITNGSNGSVKFLPLKTTTLTAELKRKARDELGETEEKIRDGLRSLKNFIENEKLPIPKDDYFLLTFLRGRKFRIKDAQDNLRRYVPIQRDIMEVACMDFSVIRKLLSHKIMGLLPYRDEEGRVIAFLKTGIWTPEFCTALEGRKCGIALMHFSMQFPPTSVSGYRILLDGDIRSADEVFYNLGSAKYLGLMPRKYPARVHRVESVNEHRLFRFAVNTAFLFAPKKFSDRFKMYGSDKEALFRSIDPSILPEEFGGSLPPISCDDYVEDLKISLETFKAKINAIYAQNGTAI